MTRKLLNEHEMVPLDEALAVIERGRYLRALHGSDGVQRPPQVRPRTDPLGKAAKLKARRAKNKRAKEARRRSRK